MNKRNLPPNHQRYPNKRTRLPAGVIPRVVATPPSVSNDNKPTDRPEAFPDTMKNDKKGLEKDIATLEGLRESLLKIFIDAGIPFEVYAQYLNARKIYALAYEQSLKPANFVDERITNQSGKSKIDLTDIREQSKIIGTVGTELRNYYEPNDPDFTFKLANILKKIEEICAKRGWDPYPGVSSPNKSVIDKSKKSVRKPSANSK